MKIKTTLHSQANDDEWFLEIEIDRQKLIDYFCDGRPDSKLLPQEGL